jgi:hypothetical protein
VQAWCVPFSSQEIDVIASVPVALPSGVNEPLMNSDSWRFVTVVDEVVSGPEYWNENDPSAAT